MSKRPKVGKWESIFSFEEQLKSPCKSQQVMAQGVTIDFNANLAKFEKDLNKATADMNKWQAKTQKSAAGVSKAFKGIAVTVAAMGIGRAAKGALDYADQIQKLTIKVRRSFLLNTTKLAEQA